ncbi:DUF4198 domain-containing protein [Xanthomonas melonis]|uniref:Cobalt ABC transporter substrate-binding protein n=1 Tax=Xanthomonas melonis TaxID=56456 RepID=A0A2S7DE04_9XANT|nr:DUF4198 domain-containing protein [Xanthomonas melonis]MCC4600464.1 DUF4198 domain-containing protein [Xanthomonas melonis]MCD0278567.1 DUF4198 domain-containing protein [Xanthomonas melonis]PPU72043.1 cobalt ABC transporter substrate-binding protein [Xanthomonas melonis]
MKYLTLSALLLAASASAHTPYLAPSTFAPQPGQTVTLDAAFAETFFVPEAAFDQSRFSITGPDGGDTAPSRVQGFDTRTVVEHTLGKQAGTYRFSTGLRVGAQFRTWEHNGKRETVRDPKIPMPQGATLVASFQSRTLAQTYLSVGKPDRTALAASNRGLELIPVTHPNDLYVGETLDFTVQYDGAPLANQNVEISEAVWTSDRKPKLVSVTTDAAGRARLKLDQAGTWLALTRHRTPAPADAPVREYSNSTTLTFQVLEQ